MARKELYYTVEDKGRDNGKKFYIREMSATQAEWWAIRAILAMANNGINLPDNLSDMKWSTKTGHRVRVFPVSVFRFVWG